MRPKRQHVMQEFIRKHRWTRGAELGLWQGQLFGHLLENCPALSLLIGVDHWLPVGPYKDKDMAGAERMVRAIAARYPKRAAVLHMSTVHAATCVPDGSLDFVFIDASHDELSVSLDIRAWRAKVRSGGMLTGHDADWPGVTAALNAELPGWELNLANVWTFPIA
jgi:hypothetical protein